MADEDIRRKIVQTEVLIAQLEASAELFAQPAWKIYEEALRRSRQTLLESLASIEPKGLIRAQAEIAVYSKLIVASSPDRRVIDGYRLQLKGLREQAAKMQDAGLLPEFNP